MPLPTLQDLLAQHAEARRDGGGWKICCPAHEDHHPSLSVIEKNGRLLFHCHAGCTQDAVLRALLGATGSPAAQNHAESKTGPAAAKTSSPAAPGATAAGLLPSAARQKKAKEWPTPKIAAASFAGLPLARESEKTRNFLKQEYGLSAELLGEDWRVRINPETQGRWLVYRGYDAAGDPVYKAKGLWRNERGKRPCYFLHGAGGVMLLAGPPGAALVVTGGEEKAAAAREAGCWGLSLLEGEKCLPQEYIPDLLAMAPPRIILAGDADEAGRKANQETARVLRQAGLADHKIAIGQWPENAPKGLDLSDVLKASGPEAVRQLLDSARTLDADLPRCLSAADFIAAHRPPLRYHIAGLLPEGGKLTFSATAKYGKSLMAIQLGFALAAGDCEWLGWQFGPPARVLYLQAEIMDGLLEDRLRWLFETMPAQLDRERAGRNFIIQEIAQGRPNLMSPEGRGIAEKLIEKHRPQVLILDPLAALHPGLEENEAKAMSAALDYLSGLTLKHKCAVILIHHHSKSGAARGSSVFEAWPESDLQATFASAEDHSLGKVVMRLRCAYNPGPLTLRLPTPEQPWFERFAEDVRVGDKSAVQAGSKGGAGAGGKGGNRKQRPAELVALLLREHGPLRYSQLHKLIMETGAVSKGTADNLLNRAKAQGWVCQEGLTYRAATPEQPRRGGKAAE